MSDVQNNEWDNLSPEEQERWIDAKWKQRCQEWWSEKTVAEKAEWLSDKPHIPYVAISKDGCWGRGRTQEEAIKELRKAGFRGKTAGKVSVFVLPPTLLGGHIDYMGTLTYFHDPEIGCRTDKPQKVSL